MYVKVHKKGNQWFREDGTLVGKEIYSKDLEYLKVLHGDHILARDTQNKIFTILEGYLDGKGNLIRFCTSKDCAFCSISKRTIFCKRERSTIKEQNSGYFISD